MSEPPVPGWIATTSMEPVIVPAHNDEGFMIRETIEVPAWKDPEDEEIYLADEAMDILENAKARYMGILSPEQFKILRERYGMKQKEISNLLQIGQRSWSRWESGKERPSRMTNLLLTALYEGELNIVFFKQKKTNLTDEFAWLDQEPALKDSFQFKSNYTVEIKEADELLQAEGW